MMKEPRRGSCVRGGARSFVGEKDVYPILQKKWHTEEQR